MEKLEFSRGVRRWRPLGCGWALQPICRKLSRIVVTILNKLRLLQMTPVVGYHASQ